MRKLYFTEATVCQMLHQCHLVNSQPMLASLISRTMIMDMIVLAVTVLLPIRRSFPVSEYPWHDFSIPEVKSPKVAFDEHQVIGGFFT